jgi:hypothetical protein
MPLHRHASRPMLGAGLDTWGGRDGQAQGPLTHGRESQPLVSLDGATICEVLHRGVLCRHETARDGMVRL